MPVLREAIESLHEAELETQKTLTHLKVLMEKSSSSLDNNRPIGSYKCELEIETELKWLSDFLDWQKNICIAELNDAKESINTKLLREKCKQLEDAFKADTDDENEDFGEE